MGWNIETVKSRVKSAYDGLNDVSVKDLQREMDLNTLSLKVGYRVNAAHCYLDIRNAGELLDNNVTECERSHRRYLRFLDVYQRILHEVQKHTDLVKVDFQNHRLHFIIYRPYDDEKTRIRIAVAIGKLVQEVVAEAAELHAELAEPVLRIGIDSGMALAVRNGTSGDREPLFLGTPANEAAKLLGPKRGGIFLTNRARMVLNSDWQVQNPKESSLSALQVKWCSDNSALPITRDKLLTHWKYRLSETPLAEFSFSRAAPPLKDIDFEQLSPRNTKRMELLNVFADLDGFTKYVSERMDDIGALQEAVRCLHVIRKELRDTLHDYGGRKIRYIGDCLEGVLLQGSANETDKVRTAICGVQLAASLHDAFSDVQRIAPASRELGLQVGMDLGPTSLTQIGTKGIRNRCAAGFAVINAQSAQERCARGETSFGPEALKALPTFLISLFGKSGKATGLTTKYVNALLVEQGSAVAELAGVPIEASRVTDPRAWCP